MNLDYENIILISHEDTSKDITRKGGDKITAIKPNLQEKTSNKVAGMVDIVARVVANGSERVLSFKTNEVIFGGGRLNATQTEIPLDYDAFLAVYDDANKAAASAMKGEAPEPSPAPRGGRRTGANGKGDKGTPAEPKAPETTPDAPQGDDPDGSEKKDADVPPDEGENKPGEADPPAQEKPAVRTRKRREE
jgi:hypothetical protein